MNEKEILSFLQEYAKKSGFILNSDKKQLNFIIKGLKADEDKYGFRFCTCRVATGNFDKDRLIICPCIYHKQEIVNQSHCFCKLFFIKDNKEIIDNAK